MIRKLQRRFLYAAPTDLAGGALEVEIDDENRTDLDDLLKDLAGDEDDTSGDEEDAPAPAQITVADVSKAVNDALAARDKPEPKPEPTPTTPHDGTPRILTPAFEAREALRVQGRIMDEVRSEMPDLPAAGLARLEQELNQFYPTLPQLEEALSSGNAKRIAYSIAGEMQVKGDYVPGGRTPRSNEPVHTVRPAPVRQKVKFNDYEANGIKQINDIISGQYGVKLEQQDFDAAARDMAINGNRGGRRD